MQLILLVQMVKYIKNKSDQLRIAKSCHVDPTSGHLGLKKTVYRVRERYMWKGVWNDVKNIVSTLLFTVYCYSAKCALHFS